jgi:signal peptidase
MKDKTRVDFKYVCSFLSLIGAKSLFILLLLCAGVLAYYFICLRISSAKGEEYAPPFSIYTIVSASMTPKIKVYDVIINVKVDNPTDIKVGDIITFTSTSAFTYGMTITHRVMDIQIANGEYEYITKGDFNEVAGLAPAK